MLTQENKSAIDYITKFDEYLNWCGAIEFESLEHTLSRFRSCLRDDYRQGSKSLLSQIRLGRVITGTTVLDLRTRHILCFRARFGRIGLDSIDST